jgi:hypothetical protein
MPDGYYEEVRIRPDERLSQPGTPIGVGPGPCGLPRIRIPRRWVNKGEPGCYPMRWLLLGGATSVIRYAHIVEDLRDGAVGSLCLEVLKHLVGYGVRECLCFGLGHVLGLLPRDWMNSAKPRPDAARDGREGIGVSRGIMCQQDGVAEGGLGGTGTG